MSEIQGKPLISSEVQGKKMLESVKFAVDYYADESNPDVTGDQSTDRLAMTVHLQQETLNHLEKMLFTELVTDAKKREIFLGDARLYLNSIGQKELLGPITLLVMYERAKGNQAQMKAIEEQLKEFKVDPRTTNAEMYAIEKIDTVYKALMDRVEGRVEAKDYEGESLLEPVVEETRNEVEETTGMSLDADTKRRLGYAQFNPENMAGQGTVAWPVRPRGRSKRNRSPGQSA